MAEKFTKKQHYIPQFYLNRFTDKDGFLHIYDTDKKKYFKYSPENYGYKNNLYETPMSTPNRMGDKFLLRNHIESIFAGYEGKFATFLKQLDKICTLNQSKDALILYKEEKEVLYRLIANLLFRNPIAMKYLQLDDPDILEPAERETLDYLLSFFSLCNTDELILAAKKKFVLTEEIEGNVINKFIDSIRELRFMFIYSKDRHFITSSFPVTIGVDQLIPYEDKTCIHCVLSPTVSILFGNYSHVKKLHNRMIIIDDNSVVNGFNKQVSKPILNYNRSLIASSKEDLYRYIKDKR